MASARLGGRKFSKFSSLSSVVCAIIYPTEGNKGFPKTRREHIMECKFAELTTEQVAYLVSANIGKHFITFDEIEEAKDALGLRNLGEADLVAVRNSVVDILGTLTSNAIGHDNWELFQQLQANMSGITTAIDSMLMA